MQPWKPLSGMEIDMEDEHDMEGSPRANGDNNADLTDLVGLEGLIMEEDKLSIAFVMELPGYNRYVSHVKHKEYPIPVWELPPDLLKQFDKYHISNDLTVEQTKSALFDVLKGCLKTIKNKEGFQFKVPIRNKSHMEYNEVVGISLLLKGSYATRSFSNGHTRHAAAVTAWTMRKITDIIIGGFRFTKRNLFYSRMELYGKQVASDRALNDISSIIGCRRESLRVVAAQRGLVLGNIVLQLTNDRTIDCSEGALVPFDLKRIKRILVHGPDPICYVLVVENISQLLYLQEHNFHTLNNCIIMTGCGQASLQIREFLRMLKERTGLRVYGLSDADPGGAQIMVTYARGSIATATENFHVAVPSIHWVGLTLLDLDELKIKLPCSCFKIINTKGMTKLQNLLDDKHLQLSDKWREVIQTMIDRRRKFTFEELYRFGISYFAKDVLPRLIERASTSND